MTLQTDKDFLLDFVEAIRPTAEASTGKERRLWAALGHLVGISDEEAVQKANHQDGWGLHPQDDVIGSDAITVAEFREWLPCVFSDFAGRIIKGR